MSDANALDAILRLVAEGRVTPDEAEPIITALTEDAGTSARHPSSPEPPPETGRRERGTARQLRIETFEGGRRVVNVSIPAGLAASLVPGLAGVHSEQIRAAFQSGVRGRILEVDDDGDRVVISAE